MSSQERIKLILASASPRRLELLRKIGVEPEVRAADVEELSAGLPPAELVRRNAELKARAVADLVAKAAEGADGAEVCILAADTVVALADGDDGAWRIFGKPEDEAAACAMLRILSGREHSVFSGVAVWYNGRPCGQYCPLQSGVAESRVRFRELAAAEIADYVAGGEPLDKAGAYAIQGGAAAFVSDIVGDFDNIVGLPISLTRKLLPPSVIPEKK